MTFCVSLRVVGSNIPECCYTKNRPFRMSGRHRWFVISPPRLPSRADAWKRDPLRVLRVKCRSSSPRICRTKTRLRGLRVLRVKCRSSSPRICRTKTRLRGLHVLRVKCRSSSPRICRSKTRLRGLHVLRVKCRSYSPRIRRSKTHPPRRPTVKHIAPQKRRKEILTQQ